MNAEQRLKYLRVFLIIFGLIFLVGVYPMMNGKKNQRTKKRRSQFIAYTITR